jgi:hypothetical protein
MDQQFWLQTDNDMICIERIKGKSLCVISPLLLIYKVRLYLGLFDILLK